jgi:hypothetical protein
MGSISMQLAVRLRNSRSYFRQLTEQASDIAGSMRIPKDVKDIKECVDMGFDPVHAAYVSVQNLVSFFAESVSTFDEFEPYYEVAGAAQEEYMPGGPPMSPLTGSYFTTWAFFDCRFGPDYETIGTCLLDVSERLDIDAGTVEIIRRFQGSRMGIYVHFGTVGSKCVLQELVTKREFTCHVASDYEGREGELWYVRLCPPLFDLVEYHVVFTTPYVLLDASEADWTAYLNRSLLEARDSDVSGDLHSLLKYGKSLNGWNEFVFQAFHHSLANAIFLAGLPDVKGSLPHATKEQ